MDYRTSIDGVTEPDLAPFFVGWPDPPAPAARLALLRNSHRVVVAVDGPRLVGFVNAISDGVLSAFLPLLEVLPEYQRRGIGTELVRRMVAEVRTMYMVDLVCDPDLAPFYERLGMTRLAGMAIRNRGALTQAPDR